ncbi:MAG: class I SAM-dependent methyltransferase [Proteobacteria bacterium]|nr:class I SAM-dependent methyltransferase [Pseudomonadota bacterium]
MLDSQLSATFEISNEVSAEIKTVPHFRDSHYRNWNLPNLLRSYSYGYVKPLMKCRPFNRTTVISDVGTGYGWLAFALALETPATIIAVDFNQKRVDAAKAIGTILGLDDRIDWRVGSLGRLPLGNAETAMACCLEVIEHVDTKPATVHDLSRTTSDILLISTPNGALPVVFHDTSLPGCHFLSPRMRDFYAKALGRIHLQDNNQFWRPGQLTQALPDFNRVSKFLQFSNFAEWHELHTQMLQNPIGHYERPYRLQSAYYCSVAKLSSWSYYCLPNLASIWRRR